MSGVASPAPRHERDRRPDRLLIESLADAEADLRQRVGALERERDVYRVMAQQTLRQLHTVNQHLGSLRERQTLRLEQLRHARTPQSRAAA